MKSRKSAYLNDYTKRIKDLLTTQEEIERYQAFTERLKNLADLTEMHYRSRIPFTAEHRAAFRRTYENALAAAGEVLGRQALGPVALQMRTVARELTPLLQMDLHAIELVEREPDLASRSLPELISRVRTQTADLGSQALPMGEESMPLKLQGPAGVETGMFTPVRLGEPNGQATAYSRLAGLLGQPELVNRTRPLLLNLEGGVSVLGSFSSRADGVDPDSVQPGDPLLSMQPENLDTPAAVSGLASMQLLDYLFGAARRGPENCSLRFNPPQGGQARLCGLTVRAEGVYMGSGSGDDARLAGLGAIPEALYLQLCGDEFEAKLRAAL